MDDADLTGANLIRAILSGANLTQADLTEADFSEANLNGATLLTGAAVLEGWRQDVGSGRQMRVDTNSGEEPAN
jgi:Pentapeptide repeats (8 copies)